MTQRFSIHSRDMETLCVKDGWKIFPVTLFISFKLDVYMYTTSSSLLQPVLWYKCFAYTTFSLTSPSYSILYFSGLVILHTVPWRKRRKAQKIYCGENLREKSSPCLFLSLHNLSTPKAKRKGEKKCRRWYSLVGLNIIYSTNIDFSWIEKHKRKTFTAILLFFSRFAREGTKKSGKEIQ